MLPKIFRARCAYFLTNSIYIYNDFSFYFDKKLQREESHVSESTLNTLALIFSFLDKRREYGYFLSDGLSIMDMLCQVHEKHSSENSYIFSKFYISLFYENGNNRLDYFSTVKCESKMISLYLFN